MLLKRGRKTAAATALAAVMIMMLLGCANDNQNAGLAAAGPDKAASADTANPNQTGSKEQGTEQASPRTYTDYKGHTIELPASMNNVVFAGETTGDLIELGIPMVGIFGDHLEGRRYEKEASQIENVGFPINLEKVISLNPDIIIIGSVDEKEYEQLSKIAPTIMFDTFASLDERMKELGIIFNKEKEVEGWLQAYHAKAAAMWENLHSTRLKPGETASVFTYYPGDRLFVMARAGLPQLLYGPGGLKPTPPIQEILDANEGFRLISPESLGEFAGDRIFILDPVDDEAKRSTEALLESPIWKGLPAVKDGHVYRLYIQESDSDAFTRLWLLDKLPEMLSNN